MNLRLLTLLLSISLTQLFLTGCEELGLEDEDAPEDRQEQKPEPPPPVIIVDPQVAYPVVKNLYFTGTDYTDEENPTKRIYQYNLDERNVTAQRVVLHNCSLSNINPKFIAVGEQPDDSTMHCLPFGKTNRFSSQSRDSGS